MSRAAEPPTLRDQVRLARLASGWTQEDLARRAGVTTSTVRNIESGRTQNPYKLRDVFRALGLEWIDDHSPLREASDEEFIAEARRRGGERAAETLRGYIAAERAAGRDKPATSQSDNEATSA